MLRKLLKTIFVYVLALFLLPSIISGVTIVGGWFTLLVGGFALTLMFLILKPILGVLTFPFNLISFGLFSIFTNGFILFLLTKLVPNIKITKFIFHSTTLAGFAIPQIHVNTFFAFVFSGIVISIISGIFRWIIKE